MCYSDLTITKLTCCSEVAYKCNTLSLALYTLLGLPLAHAYLFPLEGVFPLVQGNASFFALMK